MVWYELNLWLRECQPRQATPELHLSPACNSAVAAHYAIQAFGLLITKTDL